jgi:hypothetical protein
LSAEDAKLRVASNARFSGGRLPLELPIACSLDATELPARLAAMTALGREALLDARVAGTSARLRFASMPGVRDQVDSMVAAESMCCSFLTMAVAEDADVVVLSIDAPQDAQGVLAELVDAFTAGRAAA